MNRDTPVSRAKDALIDAWARRSIALEILNERPNEVSLEAPVHGGMDGILLIAFFNLKIAPSGHGYMEFGLQLTWPRAREMFLQLRPRKTSIPSASTARPAIATLPICRDPSIFPRTTPILLKGSTEDWMQLFEENRDAYLHRAIPRVSHLCEPQQLVRELQKEDRQQTISVLPVMLPVLATAAAAAAGSGNHDQLPSEAQQPLRAPT